LRSLTNRVIIPNKYFDSSITREIVPSLFQLSLLPSSVSLRFYREQAQWALVSVGKATIIRGGVLGQAKQATG